MLRIIFTMLLVSSLAACKGRNHDAAPASAPEASGQPHAVERVADDVPYPYAAIITCSSSGIQADIVACFSGSSSRPDTNLEMKNGDKYNLYQPSDLWNLGEKTSAGVRIPLARNFELTMQNASDMLILGVKIVNNIPSSDFDKVIYEKKAGEFGVIKVSD
jgi:hypothetical protein